MKKMKIIFSNILILSGLIKASELSNFKPHEKWWEKNLSHKMGEFASWLGDEDATSRKVMRSYIKSKGYKTVLDVPCGLCTEYVGYRKEKSDVQYIGLDITPCLVERAQNFGINVLRGSIEAMPFQDSSIEACYSRHILEHLDYYEKAVKELIRVAQKEVVIIFFIKPQVGKERIDGQITDGALLYHNTYDRQKLENFIMIQPKVSHFEWQEITHAENALHIFLK